MLRHGGIDPLLLAGPKLLFRLTGANMAVTTDQQFTKIGNFTNYAISEVVSMWKSGAFNTLCAGGIYTAASKGGTTLIASTQTYAALTGTGTAVKDTLAALLATTYQTATPYLSLTTANGAALTADVFIYGYVLD